MGGIPIFEHDPSQDAKEEVISFLAELDIPHVQEYHGDRKPGQMFWIGASEAVNSVRDQFTDPSTYSKLVALTRSTCMHIWNGEQYTPHMQERHGASAQYAAREVAESITAGEFRYNLRVRSPKNDDHYHTIHHRRNLTENDHSIQRLLIKGGRYQLNLDTIKFLAFVESLTRNDHDQLPDIHKIRGGLPKIHNLNDGDLIRFYSYLGIEGQGDEIVQKVKNLASLQPRLSDSLVSVYSMIPPALSLTSFPTEEKLRHVLDELGVLYTKNNFIYPISWHPIVIFANLIDYCESTTRSRNRRYTNFRNRLAEDPNVRNIAGSVILIGRPITAYRRVESLHVSGQGIKLKK